MISWKSTRVRVRVWDVYNDMIAWGTRLGVGGLCSNSLWSLWCPATTAYVIMVWISLSRPISTVKQSGAAIGSLRGPDQWSLSRIFASFGLRIKSRGLRQWLIQPVNSNYSEIRTHPHNTGPTLPKPPTPLHPSQAANSRLVWGPLQGRVQVGWHGVSRGHVYLRRPNLFVKFIRWGWFWARLLCHCSSRFVTQLSLQ